MATRDEIISLADSLIRDKGYNAFSFKDISRSVGIKTSSIHYHFPFKSDLGVSVVREQIRHFGKLKAELADKDPIAKLEGFFGIYAQIKSDKKICLVGSLATDFNTVEENLRTELKALAEQVLDWVTAILEEGQKKNLFVLRTSPRTKALMIISNMLAIVQLVRLTGEEDFETVKSEILHELSGN